MLLWSLRFKVRQYWLGSLWIIPVADVLAGALLAIALVRVDSSWKQSGWLLYSEGTALTLLSTLLTATITFTGFVFTMLLLVPQFGGSQLSARVLHLVYRDWRLKLMFGTFLGTMTYIFVVMSRTRNGFVPSLSLWLGGCMLLASILLFLAFVSYFVQHLRPATAATAVANQGRRVIERLYPGGYVGRAQVADEIEIPDGASIRTLRHTGAGGVILAVSRRGLVEMAERADCTLALPHSVGDYVASGAVIVEVIGGDDRIPGPLPKHMVALGAERTFEQDPGFALRILVDIAAKALSPAINDPTTAVHVIDRIEDLLMLLSQRHLAIGALRDRAGRIRVHISTPTWEEFLLLSVTEIRQYGHDSVQVMRRLQEMLWDLSTAVPHEYLACIDVEFGKLNRSIERSFADQGDRLIAVSNRRAHQSTTSAGPLHHATSP